MRRRHWIAAAGLLAAVSLFSGCACSKNCWTCSKDSRDGRTMKGPAVSDAVCLLRPTQGSSASGEVRFHKVDRGVRVSGRVEGLSPGAHGFHVHQYGDLRSSDGTSAGGHFNPENMPHGHPDDAKRHVGDLGNIEADANGVATIDMVDDTLVLNGPHSILGRGLVVHAGEDKFTQPTGDAGGRVAVGVIGVANTESGQ